MIIKIEENLIQKFNNIMYKNQDSEYIHTRKQYVIYNSMINIIQINSYMKVQIFIKQIEVS